MNLFDPAQPGVAVREAYLRTGFADYLLFVEGKALSVIEAKKVGTPLSGVEAQSARYAGGLRPPMQVWLRQIPLPFRYESTGVETFFTNGLDPDPRARRLFAFHRPETLAAWVQESETLRGRLRQMPPLLKDRLWGPQVTASEQAICANLARAERLRQSILHRAFNGRLVPQESDDAQAQAITANSISTERQRITV